jgi:hypothetical protein
MNKNAFLFVKETPDNTPIERQSLGNGDYLFFVREADFKKAQAAAGKILAQKLDIAKIIAEPESRK